MPRLLIVLVIILASSIALASLAGGEPVESRRVFIEDLTCDELGTAIRSGSNRVLIFAGSVEASGPHLALGKHNFRSRAYAEQIARQLGQTLVAPIIPVAPTSEKLQGYPGTLNVRSDVFSELVSDIVRSLAKAGFKYIILMGDHGGSQEPLRALAKRADLQFKTNGIRVFFSGDGYKKSTDEIEKYAQDHHMEAGGHGGLWDTSELWAVAPFAVRREKLNLRDASNSPLPDAEVVTGDAKLASPELGRIFGDIRVRNVVEEIRALLGVSH